MYIYNVLWSYLYSFLISTPPRLPYSTPLPSGALLSPTSASSMLMGTGLTTAVWRIYQEKLTSSAVIQSSSVMRGILWIPSTFMLECLLAWCFIGSQSFCESTSAVVLSCLQDGVLQWPPYPLADSPSTPASMVSCLKDCFTQTSPSLGSFSPSTYSLFHSVFWALEERDVVLG